MISRGRKLVLLCGSDENKENSALGPCKNLSAQNSNVTLRDSTNSSKNLNDPSDLETNAAAAVHTSSLSTIQCDNDASFNEKKTLVGMVLSSPGNLFTTDFRGTLRHTSETENQLTASTNHATNKDLCSERKTDSTNEDLATILLHKDAMLAGSSECPPARTTAENPFPASEIHCNEAVCSLECSPKMSCNSSYDGPNASQYTSGDENYNYTSYYQSMNDLHDDSFTFPESRDDTSIIQQLASTSHHSESKQHHLSLQHFVGNFNASKNETIECGDEEVHRSAFAAAALVHENILLANLDSSEVTTTTTAESASNAENITVLDLTLSKAVLENTDQEDFFTPSAVTTNESAPLDENVRILDLTLGQAVTVENLEEEASCKTSLDDLQIFEHVGSDGMENEENKPEDEMENEDILPIPQHPTKLKPSRKRLFQENRTEEESTKKAKLSGEGKFDLKEAGCAKSCLKKCASYFTLENRQTIHANFMKMSTQERKLFILHTCKRFFLEDKDKKVQKKFIYRLKLDDVDGGYEMEVCKPFFLTTLGFKKNNDTFVYNVLSKTDKNSLTPPEDRRGKNVPNSYIDRTVIKHHIDSFHPTASHYRREHAPNVRYLPSDVTIQFMYNDFMQKFSYYHFTYEFYRKVLQEENIHFTKLGHELCEKCRSNDLHKNIHSEAVESCNQCMEALVHKSKYTKARALYKSHSETQFSGDTICFSTDMQKVIMLPRMEEFKVALFTRRLPIYNQTFVPVGTKQKHPYLSFLWHAALSGRDKEDAVSTFQQFFLHFRDMKTLIIWLDNCAAQNKNWTLLTFLVSCINSPVIQAETITLCYFEPGHTFMSSDTFHHLIELSMKNKKFVYDFEDMKRAVAVSRKGPNAVVVKEMRPEDFCKFTDESSVSKRNGPPKKNNKKKPKNKSKHHEVDDETPEDDRRFLLKDVVQLQARRGSYDLFFKEDHESENWKTLDFLKNNIKTSQKFPEPPKKTEPRGISSAIKKDILKNLVPLMPEGRKIFWRELPEGQDVND